MILGIVMLAAFFIAIYFLVARATSYKVAAFIMLGGLGGATFVAIAAKLIERSLS